MDSNLKKIQTRIDRYEHAVDDFLQEFHDVQTMAYFSDRFGPDHPVSSRADQGVALRRQLMSMKAKVQEFTTQILDEFPTPYLDEAFDATVTKLERSQSSYSP